MCGRVQLDLEIGGPAMRRLVELLQQQYPQARISSGEKYPSDLLPVLTRGENKPRLSLMRWGVPLRDSSKLVINARAETAADKPMFRESLTQRRCLLPVSGFYEWSHDSHRRKYLFRLAEGDLLYLAGLYQTSREEQRFVVLTQAANASMLDVHQRMPLIIRPAALSAWLSDPEAAAHLLRSPGPELTRLAQSV